MEKPWKVGRSLLASSHAGTRLPIAVIQDSGRSPSICHGLTVKIPPFLELYKVGKPTSAPHPLNLEGAFYFTRRAQTPTVITSCASMHL